MYVKKALKEKLTREKKTKSSPEEKDSRNSSKKACRISTTKTDTPP